MRGPQGRWLCPYHRPGWRLPDHDRSRRGEHDQGQSDQETNELGMEGAREGMIQRLRRLAHPLLSSISLRRARRMLTRRGQQHRWPPWADLASLALLGLLLTLVLGYAAALPQNTLV